MKQQQQVMIVVALVVILMVIMWLKSTHQQRSWRTKKSVCDKGGSSECYEKVRCGGNGLPCPRGNCNQCCNNHTRGNKGTRENNSFINYTWYCKDDIPKRARLSGKRRIQDMGFSHDKKCSSVKDVNPCDSTKYDTPGKTAWYGPL